VRTLLSKYNALLRVVGARKNKDRSAAFNGHRSTGYQAVVVKPRDSRTKADAHQPRRVTTAHRNESRDDDREAGQPVAPHRAKIDGRGRGSLPPVQQDSRRQRHHSNDDDDDARRGHRTMNNVLPRIDENDNVMSTAAEANHSTDSESMTDKDEPKKPCKIKRLSLFYA